MATAAAAVAPSSPAKGGGGSAGASGSGAPAAAAGNLAYAFTSSGNLYGLQERCVAAESLHTMADEVKRARPLLEAQLGAAAGREVGLSDSLLPCTRLRVESVWAGSRRLVLSS